MHAEPNSGRQSSAKPPEQEHSSVMKVKKMPVSNILMFHDTELDIYEHNKGWIEYAKTKLEASYQECRLVASHHVLAGTSVKMFMLKKNQLIFYQKKNTVIPMKIMVSEVRNAGVLRATSLLASVEKSEPIKFERIVTNPSVVKTYLKKFEKTKRITGYEPDFYMVPEFKQAQKYADISVNQVIQPGQYFELQLAESPHLVAHAKVLKNYRGLLLVAVDQQQRWVHMFDPLCHGIGWTARQGPALYRFLGQSVKLIQTPNQTPNEMSRVVQNAVPQFVFRNNCVMLHRVEEGDILAVADHKNSSFWYAHVVRSDENSQHFFNLKVGNTLVVNRKTNLPFYFHIYHPKIFSIYKIRETGLPIMLPENFNPNPNETDISAYQRVFTRNGRVLGDNIGIDYEFQSTVVSSLSERVAQQSYSRMSSLKFVEVLRTTSTGAEQMIGAMVLGFKNDFLRIRLPGEERPIHMHIHDPKLFHLGSCIDMNLAISFDREFMEMKRREPKSGDEFTQTEVDRTVQSSAGPSDLPV